MDVNTLAIITLLVVLLVVHSCRPLWRVSVTSTDVRANWKRPTRSKNARRAYGNPSVLTLLPRLF